MGSDGIEALRISAARLVQPDGYPRAQDSALALRRSRSSSGMSNRSIVRATCRKAALDPPVTQASTHASRVTGAGFLRPVLGARHQRNAAARLPDIGGAGSQQLAHPFNGRDPFSLPCQRRRIRRGNRVGRAVLCEFEQNKGQDNKPDAAERRIRRARPTSQNHQNASEQVWRGGAGPNDPRHRLAATAQSNVAPTVCRPG